MMARNFLSRLSRVSSSARPAQAAVWRRHASTSPGGDKDTLAALFGEKKAPSNQASFDSEAVVRQALTEANPVASTPAPLTGERVSVLVQGVTVNLDECWWTTRTCIQLLESLHDVTGLPWWATLVGFVFVLRTALLPTMIANLRNGAKLHVIQPQLAELQANGKTATTKEEKMALRLRMIDVMKSAGYKSALPVQLALVQIPLFFTAFRAQTVLIPLHADEMATGGMLWFTNLAYTDSTYALPILSSTIMLASMELGAEAIAEKHRALFRGVMRGLAVVSVPLLAYLPAGSMLFILAHNVFSLGWSLLMRVPSFRRLCGLQPTPPAITIAKPPPNTPPPPPTTQRFYNAESGKIEVKPIAKK